MKKSKKFLLAIPLIALFGTLAFGGRNHNLNVQKALAEEPVSVEVSEEPTSAEITSFNDSEDVVINIDEEISKISQGAKDFIECAKAILNQPIVIGGVSVSIGAIILWVVGKIFGNYLVKKNSKTDKKFENIEKRVGELLAKIGIQQDVINALKELINILIENTKNIQVRELLEKKYAELENIKNGDTEKAKEIINEAVDSLKKVKDESIGVVDDTKQQVIDLFKDKK